MDADSFNPEEGPAETAIPEWLEAAFLTEYLAAPDDRPVEAFVALFPEHEEAVRRLYARRREDFPEKLVEELRIGPYRIREEIGRGGQAVVYRGQDEELERAVAVKVMRLDLRSGSQARLRLAREARLAARIRDPGICPVLHVGTHEGSAYVAMPFVEGVPLDRLVEAGRAGAEEADPKRRDLARRVGLWGPVREREERLIAFFRALAGSLGRAHAARIIHRDIKPANVMVTPEGAPVILDLGLARDDGDEDSALTQEGQKLGTPAYMAPELIAGGGAVATQAADVWAVGVMLYECLTGELPFRGPNREVTYRRILESPPPPVSRLVPGLSGGLRRLLEVTLAKETRHRYADAAALAGDLERLAARKPLLARPPGPWGRLRLWVRRRPVLAGGTAVLVLVVTAALVLGSLFLLERRYAATVVADRDGVLRGMVKDLLYDVHGACRNLPGTTRLRLRMVDKAQDYLRVLERDEARDPALRMDRMVIHLHLGDVLGNPQNQNLGRPAEARAHFDRALALGEELLAADLPPERTGKVQGWLALVLNRVGIMRMQGGKSGEAMACLDRSNRLLDELAAGGRLAPDRAALRFSNILEMAKHWSGRGDWRRALAATDKVKERMGEGMGVHLSIHFLSSFSLLRAFLLHQGGRPAEAYTTLAAAEPRVVEAAQANPGNQALWHQRSALVSQRGRFAFLTGRPEIGGRCYDRALGWHRDLLARSPDNEQVRRLLARTHKEYAACLMGTGRPEAADRHLVEAERIAAALLAANPRHYLFRRLVAEIRYERVVQAARAMDLEALDVVVAGALEAIGQDIRLLGGVKTLYLRGIHIRRLKDRGQQEQAVRHLDAIRKKLPEYKRLSPQPAEVDRRWQALAREFE